MASCRVIFGTCAPAGAVVTRAPRTASSSTLRLPTTIPAPISLRTAETVLALQRDVLGLLLFAQQRVDLAADRLSLGLEQRPDRLPQGIHGRLMPLQHRPHAVLLGLAQTELGPQPVDVAGPGLAVAVLVAAAVGHRCGGAATRPPSRKAASSSTTAPSRERVIADPVPAGRA